MIGFLQKFRQKEPLVQFGLSESDTQFCLATCCNGEVSLENYAKTHFSAEQLHEQMAMISRHFRLVRAVPAAYVWRKCLLLPTLLDDAQCHRTVIQQLKQALPISLNDIYFDYQTHVLPENHATQLTLYALTKTFAENLTLHPQTYLECEWLCIQRAYHFLAKQMPRNPFNTGYWLNNKILQFGLMEIGLNNLAENHNLDEIYTTEELSSSILQIYTPVTADNPALYLAALGASLWQA